MKTKQVKKSQFQFLSVRVKLLIGIFLLSVVLMIFITLFLFFQDVKTKTTNLYEDAKSYTRIIGISVLDHTQAIGRINNEQFVVDRDYRTIDEEYMYTVCEEMMPLDGIRCAYAMFYIPKKDGSYDYRIVDDKIFWGKDSSGKRKEKEQKSFEEQYQSTDFYRLGNEVSEYIVSEATDNNMANLEEFHRNMPDTDGDKVSEIVHEKTLKTQMIYYSDDTSADSKQRKYLRNFANSLGIFYGIVCTTVFIQDDYDYFDIKENKFIHVEVNEPQPVESIYIEVNPFYYMKDTQKIVNDLAIWFYVVTIFFMGLLYLYVSVCITIPLKKLTNAALSESEIRENGKLVAMSRFKISNRDEIGELHKAMKNMEDSINRYVEEITVAAENRKKMESELEIAMQIQFSALPAEFPVSEEYELYATMKPAKEVGGDFYDFFMIDDDHMGLVMADVSDKGIPAAMFMMRAKTFIKATAKQIRSPKKVLETANENMCKENGLYMFVTVWLGIIDLKTGEIHACNAL